MARGRWKLSAEQVGAEAYAVLIEKRQASRTYPKAQLVELLAEGDIYRDFLKLCLEHDESSNLSTFRKGLLLVIKAIGPSKVALETGVSRVTLYRMLTKGGNPRLTSLLALFKVLKIHMWVVDEEFIKRREPVVRPRDQKYLKR
jgi:probable addiction module antidote protein